MQESASARTTGGSVVSHKTAPHTLPFYTVPDDGLEMGASLGNSSIWVTTKGTGAIDGIFSVGLGQCLSGTISIRYAGPGHRPIVGEDGDEAVTAPDYVGLYQDAPGTFELHPAYQRHRFVVAGAMEITETVFVPLTGDRSNDGALPDNPPVVYQTVEVTNGSQFARNLRVFGYARLRGALDPDLDGRYDEDLRALVVRNAGQPDAVRVFGVSETPSGYATSFDYGQVYDYLRVRALSNDTGAHGDVLGCLQADLRLAPGETRSLAFITSISCSGEADAVTAYREAQDYEGALSRTSDYLNAMLARSEVLTPDPLINQGALWSKVNMLRVMGRYPQGPAFTNNPGISSNVVGRDSAWFVYGNDHFMPSFSRVLLDTFARLQYEDGKIPEYYSALDGRVEDDGLNINDDTPLYILAINHHYRSTGNKEWLRTIYPSVAKAARYIIAQEDERGLVFCSAQDPRGSVWAIASWRNIIKNYSINGAVTEINAECSAALRAAGHLAENLGQPQEEAREFFDAAQQLRAAMDTHLLNPENGLYYLNIDVDGNKHTDVTGDEIFPVMFRVCGEDTGFRIISRLNSPDFWTPGGLRTASRNDPLYDPSAYVGLIGGVWPGLTWWYAFAAAGYHPDFMVNALRASFEHYAANPKTNNTVPGQFSEWFDGESLVNRGMRLSPWEPPRFLWAAVEGVCGLMLTPDLPSINPLVPGDWKWVAMRRLPYHGREVTYFAARHDGYFRIFANCDVRTDHEKEVYEEDVSTKVHAFSASAAVVALRRPGEIMVLVGNVGAQTSVVPIDLEDVLNHDAEYDLRIYNSERGAWEDGPCETGHILCSLAVPIESDGFRAIQLKERGKG